MLNIFSSKDKPVDLYNKSNIAFICSFTNNSLTYAFVGEVLDQLNQIIHINFRNYLIHGEKLSGYEPGTTIQGNHQFRFKETGEELLVGQPFHYSSPPDQIMILLLPAHAEQIMQSDLIDLITGQNEFISLLVVNEAYWNTQNTADLNRYKQTGLSTSGLAFKEVFTGTKEIDTSKNPGYATVIKNSWLMAAWKMWFKNDYIDRLFRKDINNFANSFNRQRSGAVTYLQLYEHQYEPHYKKSIEAQKQFKSWIGFDNIVQKDKRE